MGGTVFERTIDFSVYYVPEEIQYPEDEQLGATWLTGQSGDRSVLVTSISSSARGTVLGRLMSATATFGVAQVGKCPGGAVLVPHPTEALVGALTGQLANRVTAACLIEGANEFCRMWLADVGALSVVTGEPHPPADPIHPVAVYAMTRVKKAVNHNNALVQAEDKSYAVLTLQELHRGGYLPEPTRLAAWAAANGFTAEEVKNLRKYTATVLAGRRFQLRDTWGPDEGARTQWEQRVREADGGNEPDGAAEG